MEIETPDEDNASDGMQTVFRFQKEGSPRPREASFRSAVGVTRLSAGDPLSAGKEAGRRMSPANNNANPLREGITDRTLSRGSGLETGREERISPRKIAAASVEIGSQRKVRSLGVSVPDEAGLYHRTHKSNVPDGGVKPVSRSVEAFSSQPTGRGAPSETSLSDLVTETTASTSNALDISPLESESATTYSKVNAHGRSRDARTIHNRRSATLLQSATPEQHGESASRTYNTALRTKRTDGQAIDPGIDTHSNGAPNAGERSDQPSGFSPAESGAQASGPSPATRSARPASPSLAVPAAQVASPPSAPRAIAAPSIAPAPEPSLVIGRIDVVVVAREPQALATSRTDNNRGFMSRNYLKRL